MQWEKWCWWREVVSLYKHQPVTQFKLFIESHTELYSSTYCFGLPSGLPKLNHLIPHIELSSIALD